MKTEIEKLKKLVQFLVLKSSEEVKSKEEKKVC